MAASRLLGAAAACVILLSFAAGHRTSGWSGCQGSDSDSHLLAEFLNFGTGDFPLKIPCKKCFKIIFFFVLCRDPVLELQFLTPLRVVLLCFATRSLQIAL